MSAFIVGSETIDKIIKAMKIDGMEYYARKYGIETQEGADKFGEKLLLMNIEAVGRCYSENTEAIGEFCKNVPLSYHFTNCRTDPVAAYKAARCLQYQCMEDDIPKKWTLYKSLEEIIAGLAARIIESLPQYDAAAWG